ncbi:MAG: hypothetical protein QM582_17860 [Micropruina sp.]|uniref:hypothetical protein n=1 Tax=Micropruina sp. TaxID=2737536 RepID=UPI0039E6C0A5
MKNLTATVRYLGALLLSTQRWAPPAIILVGLIAWIWATPPLGIDTVRVILPVLFALASWVGHVLRTIEDAGEQQISVSCLGSATRLMLTEWALATVLAAVVPALLVTGIACYGLAVPTQAVFSGAQTLASLLAIVCVASTGSALGTVTALAVPSRPGWAAGLLILIGLLQASPWLAPTSQLANALPVAKGALGLDLLLGIGLAVVITGGLLFTVGRLCRWIGIR